MGVVALRLRTAPDLDAGRRLLNLADLEDKDVLKAMEHVQRQRHGGRDFGFALRRVVALSLVLGDDDGQKLVSMTVETHSERDMLSTFFEHAGVDGAVLVTWNGSFAHLPVLQTRALILDVPSAHYWHGGRSPDRHVEIAPLMTGGKDDLLDLIEVGTLAGLPRIDAMSEEAVRDAVVAGDCAAIGAECDQLAVHTYLLYLRLRRIRGEVSGAFHARQVEEVRAWLGQSPHSELQAYAEAWFVEQWPLNPAVNKVSAHGA
ncbi:MAG: hypothetical protein H6981_10030 [Gammaproteobacteria bacterium]|nr:hypothetical protein [Gammaproteobacteria bacterium]MCP5137125.1 hypothetical protein [Gammaproteobacteria bacterium]